MERIGQIRPTRAPVSQPAAHPLGLATKERPQPATNNLDVPQSAPSKFDLGLEKANIPQRGGRGDKAIDGIPKTAERRSYEIHFRSPLRSKTEPGSAGGAQVLDLIQNSSLLAEILN
jgi:hypothetical protein